MEEAMDKFETMVGSAEQKLESIEKKIDDKFSKHLSMEDDDDDEVEDKEILLKTLEEVKCEYKSLCREAAELSQAQRQMAEAFQQELLSQVNKIQMLQDKGLAGANQRLDGDPETAVNQLVRRTDGENSSSQSLNGSGVP